MTTFRGQGGIIQIHDNGITRRGLLKTFRRQIIKLNMWKIVKKKKVLKCCPKSEIMLSSAQKPIKKLKSAGNVK